MEINLETEESIELTIDGTCEFKVWGERNEEGTMIMKYEKKQYPSISKGEKQWQ